MSTEDNYTAQIPKISDATINPNPVSMNGKVLLSVLVTDETVILYPEVFRSNEIYSGEAS